ncbi:MAG: polysulfide reductase, partial [Bradymonadaceae bacterium]
VVGAVMFLHPRAKNHWAWLNIACVLVFVGVWIEKGMGLIIPGFIPSTLHEMVEYVPSLAEWKVSVGIWALGLMIYTVALKIAIPVLTGRESLARMQAGIEHDDDDLGVAE